MVLFAVGETSVRSGDPATNFDTLELKVENTAVENARGYVLFDVSSIPATATVLEAKVELYYCGCDGIDDIGVHPAAGFWAAATVTWDTQPGAVDPAQPLDVVNLSPDFLITFDCGDTDQYVANAGGSASKAGWFITALVQGWVDGTTTNNGIVFMAFPEEAVPSPPGRLEAAFGNLELTGGCPDNPPRLLVKYRP
ncbi:MAG: DNRLRE domain-containing protein [Planctomycetota bacterium]